MGALLIEVRERCHYCSHFVHPLELVRMGGGGAVMCWNCYTKHLDALNAFQTGEPPKGCFECGITFAQLEEIHGGGNTPMYCHLKDGMYQFLCRTCSDAYERKRLDLYGDTLYGDLKKLKGAK